MTTLTSPASKGGKDEFSHYPDTGSLYVELKPDHEQAGGRTVVVSDEMNVNVDEDGTPVGIETYQYASRIADLSRLEVEGQIFGLVPAPEK